MSKLTLDALKERAEATASEDLLNSISGGTENACHSVLGEPTGRRYFKFFNQLIWIDTYD